MNKPFAPDMLVSAAPAIGPARFTADEFLRMGELGAFENMKVELSHGELIRMTPPHDPHGAMQAQIIVKLHAATGDSIGLRGEVAVRLNDDTVRGFDAGLIEPEAGTKALTPDQVHLAVEVSDTTIDQDLGSKARDYSEGGIRLVWVVDVNARVTHVMSEPGPEGYARREVVRFGEPLALPDGRGAITLD